MNCGWNGRIVVLIDKLLDKTKLNEIDWRARESRDEFYANIGENVVSIEKESYTGIFMIKIYDGAFGELIGSTHPDVFAEKEMTPKLSRLHELAKRKAMHAGEKIQEMLNFLNKECKDEDKT